MSDERRGRNAPPGTALLAYDRLPLQRVVLLMRAMARNGVRRLLNGQVPLTAEHLATPARFLQPRLLRPRRPPWWVQLLPDRFAAKVLTPRLARRAMRRRLRRPGPRADFESDLADRLSAAGGAATGLPDCLWPVVAEAAWGDPQLQHGLTQIVQSYFKRRVLFAREGPPLPDFSTAAFWFLIAAGCSDTACKPARAQGEVRRCRAYLRRVAMRRLEREKMTGFWDQWLIGEWLCRRPDVVARLPISLRRRLRRLPVPRLMGWEELEKPAFPRLQRLWRRIFPASGKAKPKPAAVRKRDKTETQTPGPARWQEEMPAWFRALCAPAGLPGGSR